MATNNNVTGSFCLSK